MALTEYEAQRQRNIDANKALLHELGLGKPWFPPKEQPKAKPAPRKRKSLAEADGAGDAPPADRPAKTAKKDTGGAPVPVRRSQRNAGKAVDYKKEQDRSVKQTPRAKNAAGSDSRSVNRRIHDPKQFGHIPGVPVGSWWETRELCSLDAVHAPWVAGISGSPDGAYSVALSGGYDDDVDLGYAFTYTGSGGRDLKGTKDKPKNLRTAPQSSDQTFDNHYNKALKVSAESKKPVRVIRGFKLRSPYAPVEGYRYDGLYTVEKAWQDKGLNPKSFLVCKFAFKRLDGQSPLPERDLEAEVKEAERSADSPEENGQEGDEAPEEQPETDANANSGNGPAAEAGRPYGEDPQKPDTDGAEQQQGDSLDAANSEMQTERLDMDADADAEGEVEDEPK